MILRYLYLFKNILPYITSIIKHFTISIQRSVSFIIGIYVTITQKIHNYRQLIQRHAYFFFHYVYEKMSEFSRYICTSSALFITYS